MPSNDAKPTADEMLAWLGKWTPEIDAFEGVVVITVQGMAQGRGDTIDDAIADADVVVIATEWPEFAKLDLARIAEVAAKPVLVDLRNLLEPAAATAAGLTYSSIGRPERSGTDAR